MVRFKFAAFAVLLIGLGGGFMSAQDLPKIQEEVVVRWWLVPVYALNKNGTPALGLKPEDFEVYLEGRKIPFFDLHKKEFQIAEAIDKSTPAGLVRPFEKKLVFLVFDGAFSSYELLEKAKKVAGTMMAQEAEGSQFTALSIEPFSGLRSIIGPTRNRDLVARNIDRYVSGKKADYLRASAMDSTTIRNIYPEGDRRNPDELAVPYRRTTLLERLDTSEKKRIASIYTQSLMTLNLILGYFRDNSKVIFLFSCGIPQSAMEWKLESSIAVNPGEDTYINITPDEFSRQTLVEAARFFNRNGSLLFLVNPAGTRLALQDQDAGEQSLRILADESGGRYYDGPEKDIAREIAGLETAYYEISFPDSVEYEGSEMHFEIRPRIPGLEIFTVKRVSRGRGYGEMSRLERQILVLNLLDQGPYAQAKLRVVEAELEKAMSDGESSFFSIKLPRELSRTEWDIFKVWRKQDTGTIVMEEEHILSESAELAVNMKQRKGFRHELVLVNGRTGTTFVVQK